MGEAPRFNPDVNPRLPIPVAFPTATADECANDSGQVPHPGSRLAVLVDQVLTVLSPGPLIGAAVTS